MRRRSRSVSPRKQRRSEVRTNDVRERGKVSGMLKGKNVGVDYAKLIEGYDNMVVKSLLISLLWLFFLG